MAEARQVCLRRTDSIIDGDHLSNNPIMLSSPLSIWMHDDLCIRREVRLLSLNSHCPAIIGNYNTNMSIMIN